MGLSPRTPGSCSGPEADIQPLSHPGAPSSNVFLSSRICPLSSFLSSAPVSLSQPKASLPIQTTLPLPQAEYKASAVTHSRPTSPLAGRVSASVASLTCLPSAAAPAWPPISRRIRCYSPSHLPVLVSLPGVSRLPAPPARHKQIMPSSSHPTFLFRCISQVRLFPKP